MGVLLTLADLFFMGSVFGWILELLFRNMKRKGGKWINPGFCTGPYVPLYGFGLCILFLLASLEQKHIIADPVWNKAVLILAMAVCMTGIEYIAGIVCLKYFKVRLWDYSNLWGNVQGIICPIFSLAWAVLGAVYYFLVHPYILGMLHWLSQNLAFSFFIGMFFGVFIIDVVHSANLVVKLKTFAEEHKRVVSYEGIKAQIRSFQGKKCFHFFRPFYSEHSLTEHLNNMLNTLEAQRKIRKKK